ncbi:MAG: putative DNA-binding protein [Firmicutes bacterium]|nr:putative DNA-binding protein [Bacillota bacterium]
MIEKTVHMGMLFDFYGQLLTDKQRLFFSLYHQDDLSLGEIAEQYGVTRQAVYDVIRRSQKILANFEEKLGLIQRYTRQRELVEMLQTGIEDLSEMLSSEPADRPWQGQVADLEELIIQLTEDF